MSPALQSALFPYTTLFRSTAKSEASTFINDEYGSEYAAVKPVEGKQQEGAQDAHEAIRPTSVFRTPASIKDKLTNEQFKLYQFIWSRFGASPITPEMFATASVSIKQHTML